MYIWTAAWQNQQNNMGTQRRLRSASASLIRAFAIRMKKHWVLSYPLSAQRRLWSDWADAPADLSLSWAHMTFCWFYHAAAHFRIETTFVQCSISMACVTNKNVIIRLYVSKDFGGEKRKTDKMAHFQFRIHVRYMQSARFQYVNAGSHQHCAWWWDYSTYHIVDQRRLRRACASTHYCQSLRCLHTWSMEVDEGSDQTSDI